MSRHVSFIQFLKCLKWGWFSILWWMFIPSPILFYFSFKFHCHSFPLFLQVFRVNECWHSLSISCFCLNVAFGKHKIHKGSKYFPEDGWYWKSRNMRTIAISINCPKQTRHITHTQCIRRIQIRGGICIQRNGIYCHSSTMGHCH